MTRPVRCMLASAALLALHGPVPARAESVLVAEEPSGILELTTENRVVIEDVRGEVLLKVGTPGEIRFISTTLDPPQRDLPVSLHAQRSTLTVRPVEGASDATRRLWVTVPEDMSVELHLEDTKVVARNLADDLTVEGERLDFMARGLSGPLNLELEGGRAHAVDLASELTLSGRGVSATLNRVEGNLDLALDDSEVHLQQVVGSVELNLSDSTLTANDVSGDFRLTAQGGKAEVAGLKLGGEIALEGTLLELRESRGKVQIEADAHVGLINNDAELHIEGYGASIRGSGNRSTVEIMADSGEVLLQSTSGPLRVEGHGLRVHLKDMTDAVTLALSASNISVDGGSGPVEVQSEFGDVLLKKTSGIVRVRSRDGRVVVRKASGPLNIEADGELVEVSWARMPGRGSSVIKNEGGDVTVRFARRGGCRVEAKSRYGRVETDHPDVRLSHDRSFASGIINRRSRPTLTIESMGSVYLLSPDSELEGP